MQYENLIFFDFDHTLVKTYESVRVWSPRGTRKSEDNRIYKPIESGIYNLYALSDDEYVDEDSFCEFDNISETLSKPISITLNLLSLLNHSKSKIFILSARKQAVQEKVFSFIKNRCPEINMDDVVYKGCNSSDPEKKYCFIKEKILDHRDIKNVLFFDDNEKVIEFVKNNIKNEFNKVKTSLFLIQHKNNELYFKCQNL